MALSERERRVLEQLERDLLEGDAQFAKRVSGLGGGTNARREMRKPDAKRLVIAGCLALAGLVLLVIALSSKVTFFGVLGFAGIAGGLFLATAALGQSFRRD